MIRVAGVVVVLTSLWLVGLALLIFVAPGRAERFLARFAASPRAHYLEQALRMVAGSGLVVLAAEMRFSVAFGILGWLVVGTTSVLLLIPWQWHHRFGEWAIPLAIRHLKLYGLGALALGLFMLYAVFGGA